MPSKPVKSHPMLRANALEKTLRLGKIEGRRRRGQQRGMVVWRHQLTGHGFERTPGDSEGQGSLVCCTPWGCKQSDTQLTDSTTAEPTKSVLKYCPILYLW